MSGASDRRSTPESRLFGEHFAKTGLIDPKFHRWLLNAFDSRLSGDYGFEAVTTEQDVLVIIEQAREFMQAASAFLQLTEPRP